MERDPEELRRMTERFEETIRRAGVKRTPQRLAIFREVARTGDHPDIVTIFGNIRKVMPAVSLDTVYRTLGLFMNLGLVTTVRPRDERVRFDANTGVHHHFVCTRCGAILDLEERRCRQHPGPPARPPPWGGSNPGTSSSGASARAA